MKGRPWMPLSVGDYLADTCHLTAQESGAYLHLLMHYWQAGCLPTDCGARRRIARVGRNHWRAVSEKIEQFFDVAPDGRWVHRRVEQELLAAEQLSAKRRAAAAVKYGKNKEGVPITGTPSPGVLPTKTTGHPVHMDTQSQLQHNSKSLNIEGEIVSVEDIDELNQPPPAVPAAQNVSVYAKGKSILGSGAGGLVTKLLAAKKGDKRAVSVLLDTASTAADPTEYVIGILRNAAASSASAERDEKRRRGRLI